jgi:MFS family permease
MADALSMRGVDLFPHATRASARRNGAGLWAVAFAFVAVMAFSTVPTPLYAIYQAQDGFSTFLITVIFAAYAVGVTLALFLAGHVSDRLGRRRTLVPAVLASLLSAVVFLCWRDLPGLLLGRVLSGLSVGVVTATATAYLGELHVAERPGASPRRAQLLASSANLGGLGLGPLVAGVLAETVRAPLTVPFALFGAVLAVAAIAAALAPETVTPREPRPEYRPQRVAVPAESRERFFGAAAAGAVAFATFGLFTALAPSFLAGTLGDTSHALAGVPAFAAFTGAVTAQFAAGTAEARRVLAAGITALSAGIGLVVAATWIPSLALFLAGGFVAGTGAGLLFKSGVATVSGLGAPEGRAEVLAGFFLAGYVGLSVPVLTLGVLAQFVDLRIALLAFAALLLAGVLAAARSLLGRQRRPRAEVHPGAARGRAGLARRPQPPDQQAEADHGDDRLLPWVLDRVPQRVQDDRDDERDRDHHPGRSALPRSPERRADQPRPRPVPGGRQDRADEEHLLRRSDVPARAQQRRQPVAHRLERGEPEA